MLTTCQALRHPPRSSPPPLRRLPNLGAHRESNALIAATTTTPPAIPGRRSQHHIPSPPGTVHTNKQHPNPPAHPPAIPLLPPPLRPRNRQLPPPHPRPPLLRQHQTPPPEPARVPPLPPLPHHLPAQIQPHPALPAPGAHLDGAAGQLVHEALPAVVAGVAVRPAELGVGGQLGGDYQ